MLKKKALRKILTTTLTMFIILVTYTIPTIPISKQKVLRTNFIIENISSLTTDSIYLRNKEGYFVKTNIFMDTDNLEEKIEKIIEYLREDNTLIPMNLKGYIKENIKLLNYFLEDNNLHLTFSKELESSSNKEEIITGIVYSLLEQEKINSISISIENSIEEYNCLTKEIGINKEYLFSSRKDITKVVVYYLDNTNSYYVPITKYLNDNREKIEIIVEEIKKNHKDLISPTSIHTKLLNYKEEENVFFVNFNSYLLDDNQEVTNKILNTIAFSIFDNYDVNMVMFEVDQKEIKYISR